MTRPARPLFPRSQRQAVALGERLLAARLRRRLSATELAERAFVSRPTIARLEAGEATVSLAILLRVLEILGLADDLDRLAEHDELGQRLADARAARPRRPGRTNLAERI